VTVGSHRHQVPPVLVSESSRRLLERRVQQLEARRELLRSALEDPERGREIVHEHLRLTEERDRLVGLLDSSRSEHDGPGDPHVVEVGDTVGIRLADGTEEHYLIVHGFEVELGDRRISPDSPLGRALLGRHVGDVVDVDAPSGTYRCTVTAAPRA
jgi:transcription elongation factor GreA